MKLTENKLREIIKEELKGRSLEEARVGGSEYITDKFKVGEEVYLLGTYWYVAKTNFKPGKSYKDSFTFVDNKQSPIASPPPTNKNAVGYKLEDGKDSAFYYCYKAGSGKTIMKLAIKGFNESVNEAALDIFAEEMNDEGVVAGVFDAVGDGKAVDAQFTKKKWDDGVPVTKFLTRGGTKSIKTPKGKFQIIETPTFWYYEINNGWAAVNKKDYGTPPFEY